MGDMSFDLELILYYYLVLDFLALVLFKLNLLSDLPYTPSIALFLLEYSKLWT
jgi:hypothetical protein